MKVNVKYKALVCALVRACVTQEGPIIILGTELIDVARY